MIFQLKINEFNNYFLIFQLTQKIIAKFSFTMGPKDKDNTSFFNDVYEIVRLIPAGKVTSYGAIANYLGTKSSARMVGWALSSAYAKEMPAHRVVNRNGILTGKIHFGGENAMQERLEAEGIKIVNNQVQDFDRVFWDPATELL